MRTRSTIHHSVHGQLTNEVQNGVSLARSYDALNRPTGYTIMQNGGGNNPVNPVNPVEISYSYDTLGRFSGVGFNAETQRSRASNAEVVVTYAYDHRGRMVTKTLCASAPLRLIKTTNYIWDDWNIIRETQWPVTSDQWSVGPLATNHYPLVTDYVWGLDLNGTLQGAGGVGGLLAVVRSDCAATNSAFCILHSALYLPTYDANGNVSEYIDESGEVVAHYDYSPFGETLIETGDLASTFTHRFSTKPWCPVTGLYEYQMRKYRPGIGRWQSRYLAFSADASNPDSNLYILPTKIVIDLSYDYTYRGKKLATTHFTMPLKYQPDSGCGSCVRASLSIQPEIYIEYFIDPSHEKYDYVKRHEFHHFVDALCSAGAMEQVLDELDFGKCVTFSCLNAKLRYAEAIHELIVTQYNIDQATFDCMEYGGKCHLISEFFNKLQTVGQKVALWDAIMDRRCK